MKGDKNMERIGFWGKGCIGKSALIANLATALTRQGRHVLQVGNDCSLGSTRLLRRYAKITPLLPVYRREYHADVRSLIGTSADGVYYLELGGNESGIGCLSRSLELTDQMLKDQGVDDALKLDYIFYDSTFEDACAGVMVPVRNKLFDRCILFSDGTISSLVSANSALGAIRHFDAEGRQEPDEKGEGRVQLIGTRVPDAAAQTILKEYASRAQLELLASFPLEETLTREEAQRRVVQPEEADAEAFAELARRLEAQPQRRLLHPVERPQLIDWLEAEEEARNA